MSRLFRRRRAFLVAENQRLTRENTALRDALTHLGRRLHAADTGPLGDTVPLPRVRSHRATTRSAKEWTT